MVKKSAKDVVILIWMNHASVSSVCHIDFSSLIYINLYMVFLNFPEPIFGAGKTDCSVCHSTNGVLCRGCLKVRYGEGKSISLIMFLTSERTLDFAAC